MRVIECQTEDVSMTDQYPDVSSPEYFFMGDKSEGLFDEKSRTNLSEDKNDFEVNLSTDGVLPWPWRKQRLKNVIKETGPEWVNTEWRQDPNHSIELWLPWRLAFVNNGNHSITAGIFCSGAKVIPDQVYDMSYIFTIIECDGRNYMNKRTDTILTPMLDPRIGAIFEIGRLIHSLDSRKSHSLRT